MEAMRIHQDKESMVDPFLVEALLNPRHRLTILRMELDIQRFMHNPCQKHFEFQHYPTSYLRLAAHRVAQYYGLQTMVQDASLDGTGNRILVIKTAESAFPSIPLSDVHAKQSEDDKPDEVKIVLRSRSSRSAGDDTNETGVKRSQVRTVEERKDDYERARARIFCSTSSDSEVAFPQPSSDEKTPPMRDESEQYRALMADVDKAIGMRDGSSSSRVAILKDSEKDRSDPDYDRSYERYVRNVPASQNFGLVPFGLQKVHLPFGHYDTGFSMNQMARSQASIGYVPPSSAFMNFGAVGMNQTGRDATPGYVQWPTAALIYAHSYEQLRHGVFQAPFCQKPLRLDYSQNH